MGVPREFTWQEVGDRVRRWRLAAGLTQRTLAAKTGLTQAGLAVVEGGMHEPRLSTLRKIGDALGRSTRELICGEQAEPAAKVGRMERRVRQVLESNNHAAVAVFRKGLECAELMLSGRRSPATGNPAAPPPSYGDKSIRYPN